MAYSDLQILERLKIGENGAWSLIRLDFQDRQLTNPIPDHLADEMIAFANSCGGSMLCGVTEEGQLQGLTREQLTDLGHLLVEVSSDTIKPPLRINVYKRKIEGKALVLVEIPKSDMVHERAGNAYIRVGSANRLMEPDERLRLSQSRSRSLYIRYDEETIANTGFGTLDENLWLPLLSSTGSADPIKGLTNLRLLRLEENGTYRATVAGVLLCTQSPENWLRHAMIVATHYRGNDRASEQLDAQEITGPLQQQIKDAMKFVRKSMRVAARKIPERIDMPEYSLQAVFEAIVNAVAHRDYSMDARRIRISMFNNRLEIDSPGMLHNSMTIEGMSSSQATRNEVIASIFGRIPVENIQGSDHRRFLMERRGDGVTIINSRTVEVSGQSPTYTLVDQRSLQLSIPAAKLQLTPAEGQISVHSASEPIKDVDILAIYPNKTWRQTATNESGITNLDLYTSNLPMTVYAAKKGYGALLHRNWMPSEGGLSLELDPITAGGAVIFSNGSGHLPELIGRLNPVLDTIGRTYLYADNVAIEDGRQQPVPFRLNHPIRLTDAYGYELMATIVDIVGECVLVEYQTVQ